MSFVDLVASVRKLFDSSGIAEVLATMRASGKRGFSTLVFSLAMLGAAIDASVANAGVLTYKLTGTLSGSLNGTSFTNASFTITADADPANFTIANFVGGLAPGKYTTAVSTMIIEGFASFIITSPNFGPLIVDYTPVAQTPTPLIGGAFGIVDVATLTATGLVASGASVGDIFNGPGSINGVFSTDSQPLQTTAGNLVIVATNTNGNNTVFPGTFTASASAAVPEPASIAIFSLGALGLACRTRFGSGLSKHRR
jgi:hypothetical protein